MKTSSRFDCPSSALRLSMLLRRARYVLRGLGSQLGVVLLEEGGQSPCSEFQDFLRRGIVLDEQ